MTFQCLRRYYILLVREIETKTITRHLGLAVILTQIKTLGNTGLAKAVRKLAFLCVV